MNETHEANRACWNQWADWWARKGDERGTWRQCHRDPSLVLSPGELAALGDVDGKDVCVLGSGDNEVVFALAGMGAKVTSVDIAEKQLETAARRADELGLEITFHRADVTDLSEIADGSFDLVYTGGHVSVWVSDIGRYYAEAVRILRPGGGLIVNDYHPIRRMWQESDGPKPKYRYFDRGPHTYETTEGHTQTEFNWTTAEHIQAVIDAGCVVERIAEHGEGDADKEYNATVPPGLPMDLLIVGRKAEV